MYNAECRVQSAEYRVQSAECRVQNAECRVQKKRTENSVLFSFFILFYIRLRHLEFGITRKVYVAIAIEGTGSQATC